MKSEENNSKFTVLFVCSGNSCRSPMAEGLLKKKYFPVYGSQVKIHSAGTLGIYGNPATIHAIQAAQEKGVDISSHLSKGLNEEMVADADIIFVMAEHHLEYMARYFPKYKENVFLLKKFNLDGKVPKTIDIIDPIGEGLTVYRKVISEIDRELDRIFLKLQSLIASKLAEN